MSLPGPDRYRVQGPVPPIIEREGLPLFEMTADQCRELDRAAVEHYAIPSIVLMENAAIGLRHHAIGVLKSTPNPSAIICCGPGNNGGDGLALARHLHNHGVCVRIVLTQPAGDYRGDAAINLAIVKRMGIPCAGESEVVEKYDLLHATLIVDALFGTGLSRAIEGATGQLIDGINAARVRHPNTRVLSVDLPSGMNADTGKPIGECVVRADMTVTLAALKPGMACVEAHELLGEVHVVPIGAPIELLRSLGRAIEPMHRV
jgi:hydroxyethylthiazole kinase-like uncharacterized protein yjeF